MAKKKIASNKLARQSFEQRYGMTRSQWAQFKKDAKKNGETEKVHALREKARLLIKQ